MGEHVIAFVGISVEKLPFQIFHGGKSTLIRSFDKTKLSCFPKIHWKGRFTDFH